MQPVSPQPLLSEEDYGAIEAAVMETARGRWFLAEYARRNRNADTAAVLAAIRRLERMVESMSAADARDEVARGMANIAQAIAAAELTTAASVRTPARDVPATMRAGMQEASAVEMQDVAADEAPDRDAAGVLDEASFEAPAETEPSGAAFSEAGASHEPLAEGEPAATQTPGALDWQPTISAETQPEPAAEIESLTETARVAEAEALPAAAQKLSDLPPTEEPLAEPDMAGPFPILELDDEAAEELLARDAQLQELRLPTNRLAASRRSRLDMASLLAVPREGPVGAEPGDAARAGMFTFVDEEPVEAGDSVFSAPLRLEPEEPSAREAEAQTVVLSSSWTSGLPIAPRMTIVEIETTPVKKKAALFS